MTIAPAPDEAGTRLDGALTMVRRELPGAGFGLTAAELGDPVVAEWARTRGSSVFARDVDDLDLMWRNSIRPVQAVLRCGSTPDTVRAAVHAGVMRFVACTGRELDLLAEFAHRTKYVYLGADAPVSEPHRRLQVIGLHCEVDDDVDGHLGWAEVTERLLCRMTYLRTCALHPVRLSLLSRSADEGSTASVVEASAVAATVHDALDQGCRRWKLASPKILLTPGPTATVHAVAA